MNAELIEQYWVRRLFVDFCRSPVLEVSDGALVGRLDHYAQFFAEIDRHLSDWKEVSQESLYRIFTAEGLRRHYLPVSYLVRRLRLPWSNDDLAELIERDRRLQALQRLGDRVWVGTLHEYADWLSRDTQAKLREKSIRVYVNAAAKLLEHAQVERPTELDAKHLTRFLRRHPGHRASLTRFVRFLKVQHGLSIALPPGRPPRKNRYASRVEHTVRQITTALERPCTAAKRRALVAELLARLYGVPLTRVLALTRSEVTHQGHKVVLWPGESDIRLEEKVARLFRESVLDEARGEMLFPGRNGVQPLSTHAVKYYVRQHAG
ncbi:hypothetical protein [Sediminicurvatus halobius]|uniref:Integrase n=1 Tax=Sediminicurvatus halobius TaxID=2182432 RepID=A0A2U2N9D8_9GAMM|nr:hypothetical protein [Spiribacter halobius]PWG65698.1 hypothetical protein DEM34_00020 [Spiribacter halobius]UEX77733.1 hypothetical protein LMH63_17660 [Spiribacter halobius]